MQPTTAPLTSITATNQYICFGCRSKLASNHLQSLQRSPRFSSSYSRPQLTRSSRRAAQSGCSSTRFDTHSGVQDSRQAPIRSAQDISCRPIHRRGICPTKSAKQENASGGVRQESREDGSNGILSLTNETCRRLCRLSYAAASPLTQTWTQTSRRRLHTSARNALDLATHQESTDATFDLTATQHSDPPGGIRERLRKLQLAHPESTPLPELAFPEDADTSGHGMRNPSRLGDASDTYSHKADDEHAAGELTDIEHSEDEIRLQKGDLVCISIGNGKSKGILAIFVRVHEKFKLMGQFYTVQGRWIHARTHSAFWSTRKWAPHHLVDRLIPYLPSNEEIMSKSMDVQAVLKDASVPREFGAPLIDMMTAFDSESQGLYRRHAVALDNAHQILSHEVDLRYGSLSSVAIHLLQLERSQLTPTALYTVHQALLGAPFGFSFHNPSRRATGFLQIRSKSQVKMIHEVTNWFRQWQDEVIGRASSTKLAGTEVKGVIPDFLTLAKRVVSKSRENRQPVQGSGSIGPSKVKRKLSRSQDSVLAVPGEAFDPQQQKILSFFEAYACSRLFLGEPVLNSIASTVLKATGLYDGYDEVDLSTAFMFLQEMGVVLPYENPIHHDPHLMLPSSRHSRPLVQLATALVVEAKQGFNFTDSMKDLRHDWGSLPVYCIDGADAIEIDDGISVDPNIADDGSRWLRIHIANPTAFLDKDLPISRMARHMGETVYAPDRNHVMLPDQATQRYWSLAPSRPTLTISARLAPDGNILETDVRPGVIHNVRRFSPSTVSAILSPDIIPDADTVLVVGGDVPEEAANDRQSTPSLEDAKQITDIAKLSAMLGARRRAKGGIAFHVQRNDVDVWTTWSRKGLPFSSINTQAARRIEGDPVIRTRVKPWKNHFQVGSTQTGDDMVQECMLLAAEVASLWCSERQVPILHRGTRSFNTTMSRDEYWQTVCIPAMQRNNGGLPLFLGVELRNYTGLGVISTEPMSHGMLGLDHYSKVTSPLRRYGDMITHWQIEAALRREARTGRSMIHDKPHADRSFLPFSKVALESFRLGYLAREKMILMAKTHSSYLWQKMLLFRAHHFGELKLPFDTVKFEILRMPTFGFQKIDGIIHDLNLDARIDAPERVSSLTTQGARAGDIWECAIDRIDLANTTSTSLSPIRLLRRWE